MSARLEMQMPVLCVPWLALANLPPLPLLPPAPAGPIKKKTKKRK